MALPTILISSGSGSDTQASGAGPTTALFGTTDASTSGTGLVVTLTAGTDLTNVATDGSHAIYLADSTAGARNFAKITNKAGSGGATPTVTVANAFGISLSGKSWAIGGKRASLGSTTSKKLVDNNGSAGDALAGWVLELQDGHSETVSASLTVRSSGDTTSGPLTLRGASGAGTRPKIAINSSTNCLDVRGNYIRLQDFDLEAAAADASALILQASAGITRLQGMKFLRNTGSNVWDLVRFGGIQQAVFAGCLFDTGSQTVKALLDIGADDRHVLHFLACRFKGSDKALSSTAVAFLHGLSFVGCVFHGQNTRCLDLNLGTSANHCLVLLGNTFYAPTGGAGLYWSAFNDQCGAALVVNNIFKDCGTYGLDFNTTAAPVQARGVFVSNNDTHNNTSGAYNPSGVGDSDPGLDPTFANAAGGDFSIGTNLKAQGYPTAAIGFGSTTSYEDIGAAQRQEPASSSGPVGTARVIQNIGTY